MREVAATSTGKEVRECWLRDDMVSTFVVEQPHLGSLPHSLFLSIITFKCNSMMGLLSWDTSNSGAIGLGLALPPLDSTHVTAEIT